LKEGLKEGLKSFSHEGESSDLTQFVVQSRQNVEIASRFASFCVFYQYSCAPKLGVGDLPLDRPSRR
jgi:hypothetical protein